MSEELVEFENAGMQAMRDLAQVLKAKKDIEAQEKAFKAQLLELMEQYNVKSVDNEYVKITYIAPSESVALDTKALESKEPKLYGELMEDYPKTTKRAASIRITVK